VKTGDIIRVDVPNRRSTCWSATRNSLNARPSGRRRRRQIRARLRLDVRPHIKQANEGCDFDFLETGFGKPVPEPDIF
jgi:dihydroxyacid dehydratase/phosphogluconate dehydratase